MTDSTRKRIALLFTTSNFYYRDVAAGVAAHVARHGLDWDLMAADLSACSIEQVAQWRIDGIIAEMDQPQAVEKLAAARACVVGVGSASADTPPGPFSLAGADNVALVHSAYRYLVEQGAPQLAMYSLPLAHNRHWARERELAFARRCRSDAAPPLCWPLANCRWPRWRCAAALVQCSSCTACSRANAAVPRVPGASAPARRRGRFPQL